MIGIVFFRFDRQQTPLKFTSRYLSCLYHMWIFSAMPLLLSAYYQHMKQRNTFITLVQITISLVLQSH